MENWFRAHALGEASDILMRHEVSFSPIYDIADIVADPHFIERQVLVRVEDEELGCVSMQNVVPRFSATPGRIWRTGPGVGQHNDEIYGQELGLSRAQQADLRERNII